MSLILAALAAGALLGAPAKCPHPRVIDGDSIACENGVRLRLSGIDAPEMPGHCSAGRICAPGDPVKSRDALAAAIARHRITYRPIKTDLYGRTVALVYAARVNLNCRQLSTAIYVAKWDSGGHVRRACKL